MVIRVDVTDLGSAKALVEQLYQHLDGEAVSLDTRRHQVCVKVRHNPDQTIVRALDVVESWLSTSGYGPTKVEVDGRWYTMVPPVAAQVD